MLKETKKSLRSKGKTGKSNIFRFLDSNQKRLLESELSCYNGKFTNAAITRAAKKHNISPKTAILYIRSKIDVYRRNRENINYINIVSIREIFEEIEEIGTRYREMKDK